MQDNKKIPASRDVDEKNEAACVSNWGEHVHNQVYSEVLYSHWDNFSFNQTITGGLCWEQLTRSRLKDSRALERYGYKVYSQNEEDGIIHEIFERIGTTNKTFVEFGTQDGLESNGHYLLLNGWRGLWIEGSKESVDKLSMCFRPALQEGCLKVINDFITRDNINDLIRQSGITGTVDLLSIDLDGNDYYIWDAINVIAPRVVIIEYNGKFPPDLDWKMAYDSKHVWDGSDWHGASLKALERLGTQKGYHLVATNLNGVNAFFVKKELISDQFLSPFTAEFLYNPLRLNLKFVANHPSRYFLGLQKEEYGRSNYMDIALVYGFHEHEYVNRGTPDEKIFVWTSDAISVLRIVKFREGSICRVPWQLPEKVKELKCYHNKVYAASDTNNLRATIRSDSIYIDGLENIPMYALIELTIADQSLWVPSSVLGTKDHRSLGICIMVSDIAIIQDRIPDNH